MTDQAYEYVAVELQVSGRTTTFEQQLTEQINRVALHGWRLVSVAKYNTRDFAYFERPKVKK